MTGDALYMARYIAFQIAMSLLHRDYIWGGSDPRTGFDCSGFVIELLQSVGILPYHGDWTADMLRQRFGNNTVDRPSMGCLAFYGSPDRITHVEFCIDDRLVIGASGGGSKTVDAKTALAHNARIRVKPLMARSDLVCVLDPFADITL